MSKIPQPRPSDEEEYTLDRQRIEGGLRKASGRVKDKAGKMIGDRNLEAEGKTEKAEGSVRGGVGTAKDAARDLFKK